MKKIFSFFTCVQCFACTFNDHHSTSSPSLLLNLPIPQQPTLSFNTTHPSVHIIIWSSFKQPLIRPKDKSITTPPHKPTHHPTHISLTHASLPAPHSPISSRILPTVHMKLYIFVTSMMVCKSVHFVGISDWTPISGILCRMTQKHKARILSMTENYLLTLKQLTIPGQHWEISNLVSKLEYTAQKMI